MRRFTESVLRRQFQGVQGVPSLESLTPLCRLLRWKHISAVIEVEKFFMDIYFDFFIQ